MAWHFVDAQGHDGWVRDDGSVVYSGNAEITRTVERCAAEMGLDPRGDEDALQRLMIGLYAEEGLRKVEQCNSGIGPPRELEVP